MHEDDDIDADIERLLQSGWTMQDTIATILGVFLLLVAVIAVTVVVWSFGK